MKQENIRNFSIIAHIDHGKSTLADRILEETKAVTEREMKEQLLDSMDIERERGITIKLNAVSINYLYNNETYLLNLIDTPGHVDFSYEVNRSLASCEGAILVVDATQGIEAQTLANLYLALDNNLTIIPVINKIDLPSADIPKVTEELTNLGFDEEDIILTSAKTGEGIKELLDAIITKIPAPKGDASKPLQGLIFDSIYDSYRGVLTAVRIFNGSIKKGDTIYMLESKASYEVLSILKNTPKEVEVNSLSTGEVGYIYASIKSISDVHVGDTITLNSTKDKVESLPGYKKLKSVVYCGLYPIETNQFEELRDSLAKLKLNDAALVYEPETSVALGFGFRTGFLGLLHMEVTIERIKREFNIELIATTPSVIYKLMELCQDKRGTFINMNYLDDTRVCLIYKLPLSEIVYDFFDKLKSITKGYASFDYEVTGYETSDLVKLDIMLNGEVVDALSMIVHKDFAYNRGKLIVHRLKDVIPRQLFEVPVQASIGNKVIARTDIKALRKDVLAKCYGGDITRKKKLLEKQKEGKKKMKQIGSVEVPPDAFLAILNTKEN